MKVPKFNVIITIRLLLAFIFAFSGITKLVDINFFEKSLEQFNLFPTSVLPLVKYLLPSIEILLSLFLFFEIKTKTSIKVLTLLLATFTIIVVAKLFEGENIVCGCFGYFTNDKIGLDTVLRNIILLGLAIVLDLKLNPKTNTKHYTNILEVTEVKSRKIIFAKLYDYLKIGTILTITILMLIFTYQNKILKNRLYTLLSDQEVLLQKEKVEPFFVLNMNSDSIKVDFGKNNNTTTLLALVSTKCHACKNNISYWKRLVNEIHGNIFIMVAMDSLKDAEYFYRYYRFTGDNVFYNPSNDFKNKLKGYITPQTILIKGNGEVIKNWTGPLNENKIKEILKLSTFPS